MTKPINMFEFGVGVFQKSNGARCHYLRLQRSDVLLSHMEMRIIAIGNANDAFSSDIANPWCLPVPFNGDTIGPVTAWPAVFPVVDCLESGAFALWTSFKGPTVCSKLAQGNDLGYSHPLMCCIAPGHWNMTYQWMSKSWCGRLRLDLHLDAQDYSKCHVGIMTQEVVGVIDA